MPKFRMNHQDKITERKRIKGLFLNNYPEGCIKISKGESMKHSLVKLQVAYYLKNNNFEVWSEPTLKNKLRPDLLCLHNSGIAYVIEIVCSESKKSLELKKLNYPIPIIFIDANKFNYEGFRL